jgi:uncharacterized protein YceK
MKKVFVIIMLSCFLGGCAGTTTYKKRESEWFGWGEKNKGYTETQLSQNRWMVKYHTNLYTKDEDALRLLYRRVDEFGNQACSNGFTSENAKVENDFPPISDGSPSGRVASTIIVCK